MNNYLSIRELEDIITQGFYALDINKDILDNLNVFPIPDGDTGANMTSTLAAGVETFSNNSPETPASTVIRNFISEITKCSRGNSGFILSRFFTGFFEQLEKNLTDKAGININDFSEAVSAGNFLVKKSLFSPAKGTMVSILDDITETLTENKNKAGSFEQVFKLIIQNAEKALFNTPKELPVLAKAGVVDSGALGVLIIFKGMLNKFTLKPPEKEDEGRYRFPPDPDAEDNSENQIQYRYCTEAIIRKKPDLKDLSISGNTLNDWLKSMGDSIALVNDENIIKLHIHTNNPDKVLEHLVTLGTLENSKIDDMLEQTRLISSAESTNTDNLSVLAFVPGEGFERIFEDLGIHKCFLYQEKLPTPQEIVNTLKQFKSETVITLPNNSNIIPSLLAAKELTDKNILIVPTDNVVQGISAAYGYSEDLTAEDNLQSMEEFISDSLALFIYRSTLDTDFDGMRIEKGNFFAVKAISGSKKIISSAQNESETVKRALENLFTGNGNTDPGEISVVSIYYGNGFNPDMLPEITEAVSGILSNANIEHHFGGQLKESLIINLE